MAIKLAALMVVLVAFLAGPAVCQDISCFNGWVRVRAEDAHLCPPMTEVPRPSLQPFSLPSRLELVHGYYNNRTTRSYCPKAERIVKGAVRKAVAANPGLGAGLIRLFNHDCFVRGCDGSVLLNETNSKNKDTERESKANKNSLRGLEVIDAAKAAIEAACPGRVSCADIVAFAARDASYFLSNGRINIRMPGGRYDGRESLASETGQLPGPDSDIATLEKDFKKQGLSLEDMVTLSGAHSIGRARCAFFDFSEMEPAFARELKAKCGCDNQTNVNQDRKTPYVLDRRYYQDVIDRKVLFKSDAVLNSTTTIGNVTENLKKAGAWERKFEKAMEKMGRIEVNSGIGEATEIRKVCWRVNK